MKYFELWLDESGDFKADHWKKTPSLVGGLLFRKGQFDLDKVNAILDEYMDIFPEAISNEKNRVHGTEIEPEKYGEFALALLKRMKTEGAEFVIFENKERLMIGNGDKTYLAIVAEGVIKIFQELSAQYPHEGIHIDLRIATRKRVEPSAVHKEHYILDEEYKELMKERMMLGLARRSLSTREMKWGWDLKMLLSRQDPRVGFPDIVCHSWFKKDQAYKFSKEQADELLAQFQANYIFPVFEHQNVTNIKRLLSDGAIGDAIYEWVTFDAEKYQEPEIAELLETIILQLSKTPRSIQSSQLQNVVNKIALLELFHTYDEPEAILHRVENDVIPRLKERHIHCSFFILNIYSLLLTIHTHRGNLAESERYIKLANEWLPELSGRWEYLDYILNYKNRECVHFTNCFDFSKVIEETNKIQRFIDETVGLYSLADEMGLLQAELKADVRAKVIGTRLQARCYLSRRNREELKAAIADSNLAIAEFNEDDQYNLSRQYLYRSFIDCESGDFTEALDWLARGVGKPDYGDVAELLRKMKEDGSLFASMYYVRIMAEAALSRNDKDRELADAMNRAWLNVSMDELPLTDEHPSEIILWKRGTYLMTVGSHTAALPLYKEAIDFCLKNSRGETLKVIGMGIQAELLSFLLEKQDKFKREIKQTKKGLIGIYENLMNKEGLPAAMKSYFADWEQGMNDHSLDERDFVFRLSRKIPY